MMGSVGLKVNAFRRDDSVRAVAESGLVPAAEHLSDVLAPFHAAVLMPVRATDTLGAVSVRSGPTFFLRTRMRDRHTAEKLFLEHLEWIDRAAAMTCRQHGVWGADVEDFASWLRVRLMDNDYAVIRNHRGDAKLRTYLGSIVVRQFHEWGRQRWGRWRVSARAERLGPPAPELETLVHRDGLTLEQAGEQLRTRRVTTQSNAELARLLHQLPERAPLRPVQVSSSARDEALATAEAPSRADERVTAAEADEKRARLVSALERVMSQLHPEDRIIADMHLREGLSVADVARGLNLEQKPLYRRIDRLRARLRELLKEEGVYGTAFLDEQEGP